MRPLALYFGPPTSDKPHGHCQWVSRIAFAQGCKKQIHEIAEIVMRPARTFVRRLFECFQGRSGALYGRRQGLPIAAKDGKGEQHVLPPKITAKGGVRAEQDD